MNAASLRKAISLILGLTFILAPLVNSAVAQRRRTSAPSRMQAAKAPGDEENKSCDGWRGKVTYTQQVNDEGYKNKGEFGYEKSTRVVQVEAEAVFAGGNKGSAKVSILKRTI